MSIGTPASKAINTANTEISEWVGFDITRITPVDLLDQRNASSWLTQPLQYAFTTAAISATTAQISEQNDTEIHKLYNSITFASRAYEDIKYDGLLNGVGEDGVISMGVVDLSVSTYRKTQALNMLAVANHENNATSIGPADLVYAAELINNSEHPMFGGEPIEAMDSQRPIIQFSQWEEGQAVFGDVTVTLSVTDLVGLEFFTVQLGDLPPVSVPDFANPSVDIHTQDLTDGEHELKIVARNFAGGTSTFTRNVIVANNGMVITNIQPEDGQTIRGTYIFSANVSDPVGVKAVKFILDNDAEYTPDGLHTATKSINSVDTLSEGSHAFKVSGTNIIDYVTNEEVNFIVDNTKPTVSTTFPDNTYFDGISNYNITASDNLGLKTVTVFVDGNEINKFTEFTGGTNLNVSPSFNAQDYSEGSHILHIEAVDNAGNMASVARNLTVDYTNPDVNIITPGGQFYDAPFNVSFTAFDSVGFGNNLFEIYIDGSKIKDIPNTARTFEVDPGELTDGDHTATIHVKDASGKMASSQFGFSSENYNKPILNFTHESVDSSLQNYTYQFSVDRVTTSDITVSNVKFGGVNLDSLASTWPTGSYTLTLNGSNITIVVRATGAPRCSPSNTIKGHI
ncbi:MAG: hypothetical protein GY814_13985 [Gammaproteobacteria bacterium]|nr:hypothetical protein [Gammaproteobacteria bacterium]